MAMKQRLLRAAPWLAALPGLVAGAWWLATGSALPHWEARESALASQLSLFAEEDAANDELKSARQRLIYKIEVIRGGRSAMVVVHDALEEVFRRLPAEPAIHELSSRPRRGEVRLVTCNPAKGEVLAAAEALGASSRFSSVLVDVTADSPDGDLLVTWAVGEP